MDQLPKFGTAIRESMDPIYAIYEPMLLANADTIKSTKRETFSYGPTERHELDVYHPPSATTTTSPILIFFHGGGFVGGGKTCPRPPAGDKLVADGLVYANLGHFFASKHGFTTVIANYRLHRHGARFPSGGEDFALAIRWVRDHLASSSSTARDLHLMGNSAGGTHLATFMFHHDFAPLRAELRAEPASAGAATTATPKPLTLRSATFLAAPYDFPTILPYRSEAINTYFLNDVAGNLPLPIVEKMIEKGEPLADGVRLLMADAELDPEDEVLSSGRRFRKVLAEARQVDVLKIPGHNHLTPVLALGTGVQREERWGDAVAAWMLL